MSEDANTQLWKQYRTLYHYTTWSGALGILDSGCLWSTHYRFLRDYQELRLFRNKLIEWLIPHVRKTYKEMLETELKKGASIQSSIDTEFHVNRDTEWSVDTYYAAKGEEIYITSFCGESSDPYINENGLLSQWRGYGQDGGVAIVLETKRMGEVLEREVGKYDYLAAHIADLVYNGDEDKFEREFGVDLKLVTSGILEILKNSDFDESAFSENKAISESFLPFVRCISRYKHQGFSEENEVRIVTSPLNHSAQWIEHAQENGIVLKGEKTRHYRKSGMTRIPYIKLFESEESGLPIEKIIVGPHGEKESRAATLKVMTRKKGIEIRCSEIPYY